MVHSYTLMLRFSHVYEACSAKKVSRRYNDPESCNCRIGHVFWRAERNCSPVTRQTGYIPALLKPPATGKKLPVVYML